MKAVTTAGALAVLILLTFSGAASASAGQGGTRTPVTHLINIYLENHTFDNLFGVYPSDPSSPNQGLISSLSAPLNLLQNKTLQGALTPVAPGSYSTPDPIEGNTAYHLEWDHGLMDGFAQGGGPYATTYYTAAQLGPVWDLAEADSLGARYFAPVLSECDPNTMYYLAGFSPVMND